jgi:NAD(P)-dependent dehydrogenase (short-subunit alcohol dehydrogenase family)
MLNFAGRVAFITGGGSGVGLGQAKVFAAAGAQIALADIRGDHLEQALTWFKERNHIAHGIELDVTDRAAMANAADEVERLFGPVTLLFNNAGVSVFGPLERATYADYDWMMGVNFGGVVNAVQTFVPRMIRAGSGGHIVNTASVASFRGSAQAGIYCASKFAVRGLSEALYQALAPYNIGVSILCPANVNTNIAHSIATRPAHLGPGYTVTPEMIEALEKLYANGRDPLVLAEEVKTGIERSALYIIPYPEERQALLEHFNSIIEAIPPDSYDPQGIALRKSAMAEYLRTRERMSDHSQKRR